MKFQLPSAKPSRQFALVTMRITARANTSRKVEGVMGYRHISRKCTRDDSTNRNNRSWSAKNKLVVRIVGLRKLLREGWIK